MTLSEARELRDVIRADAGLHCTVPLGHAPRGYFARIISDAGPVDFYSREKWREYEKGLIERQRRALAAQLRLTNPPRSPIEAMIDKACGLA